MRAYNASSEEARLARDLLHDWRSQGFITPEQYQRMEQETPCDLRRTNIFLRLVLFFFTAIIVAAAVGLFFFTFLRHAEDDTTIGVVLLILAAVCYAAAELIVSATRLYCYGIEESLLAFAIAFLCIGTYMAFGKHQAASLVPSVAAFASLWIWYRFGLSYIFLAAMLFLAWLPAPWEPSPSSHRIAVAITYSAGIALFAAARPRYSTTYLSSQHSIAEALLWFGLYLSLNLQLLGADLLGYWWRNSQITAQSSPTFYWTTWVLIWLIPAIALARGLREKDRLVMAAGAVTAFLTLLTNKPYLGWRRHSWDPMLLGALLIAVALVIRHWLAQKPSGIRNGFTARRLSGKDKGWLDVGVTAVGLASPNIVTSDNRAPASAPDHRFGGGDSGGAGASSDF